MPRLSLTTSGARRARAASALLAATLLLSGCIYKFTGGGLPTNIRTVYVDLFDNTTPYDFLRSDVQRQLQDQLPRNLGLRLAPQQTADAIVRGKLSGYDEAVTNFDPNAPGGRINSNQTRVQITFDAEIYDVKADRVLWQGSSISAIGLFSREKGETVEVGRRKALEDLVQKLIEGAQSQW
ncbi:MAG: LPS assembly lipoprotein LptE [Longimicrobiaceae bacterium]